MKGFLRAEEKNDLIMEFLTNYGRHTNKLFRVTLQSPRMRKIADTFSYPNPSISFVFYPK